jgi:hypothetical protein
MSAFSRRGLVAILPVALVLLFGIVTAAHASPAQVPCSSVGGGHYDCQFYPGGDGISGGAPVLEGSGTRIGYLNEGTDWVTCQQLGGKATSGSYYNHYWAYTEANDQKWGWVSAVWADGGDNDGSFAGVPNCNGAHGNPPGVTGAPPSTPAPTPTPAPAAPTPTPTPPTPGTTLPEPVNMGSYGTYHFRFQLWRDETKKRKANFNDWTAEQMMAQLNSNFSHYFTYTGCGEHLVVGARCTLDTTLAPDAPVEVIAVAPTGFAFKALGGHPEGAGRTIEFKFEPYVNAAEVSSMAMDVEAWGPLSKSSLAGPLNSMTIARTSWEIFEGNVKHRFPDKPPGGVKTGVPVEL